jgi:divalent metal cation (Fe/Co/Zn/Cd) transporter
VLLESEISRAAQVRSGRHLEFITIGWNVLEAVVALATGMVAGSSALVGFGLDSIIEVSSGAALLWRLSHDRDSHRRERLEGVTLKIVGITFLLLAAYVTAESISSLWNHDAPSASYTGIILAALSLIVMPLLARAKRRVAAQIESRALKADSRQTDICAYLSAILLGGLLLNALFGIWWADPVAALVMVPIIAKEGIEATRGERCCDSCH